MKNALARERAQDMGANTSEVFAGNVREKAVAEMYNESVPFFAGELRQRLEPDKEYVLADIGAYEGKLTESVVKALPDRKIKTIALDVNRPALTKNRADFKAMAEAQHLPLADKSVDVAMMRYVLQWNNPEKQKQMIKETARVIKDFALIEHIGSGDEDPAAWRVNMDKLLGGAVPKLQRDEQFFSSAGEIEQWMTEAGIRFERVGQKRIDNVSEVFAARFPLDPAEVQQVRDILGDNNYEIRTRWIIYPKE
jgi:hypothetical protein